MVPGGLQDAAQRSQAADGVHVDVRPDPGGPGQHGLPDDHPGPLGDLVGSSRPLDPVQDVDGLGQRPGAVRAQ